MIATKAPAFAKATLRQEKTQRSEMFDTVTSGEHPPRKWETIAIMMKILFYLMKIKIHLSALVSSWLKEKDSVFSDSL
jgi:hypothetical protein